MNKYGAMAQSHWRTWLPNRYAKIEDPNAFFATLGVQVSDRIAVLELDLAGPDRPAEEFLARVGRRNMARMQAEELVLPELVLLPAETPSDQTSADIGETDEDESDELPVAWAIPSAQETVAAVAAQERRLI